MPIKISNFHTSYRKIYSLFYAEITIKSNHRSKFGLAAAFVHATDTRYGFSSEDLRKLGGSELSRIKDLIESDHGT